MSDKINALFAFGGIWLLYIFPLYQGALELSEPNRVFNKFRYNDTRYPQVSAWYWLFPPLKINKEKMRGIKILQDNIAGQAEMDQLFRYFNKAVAWFYIAIAGLLNGLVTTNELFETFDSQKKLWLILLVDLVMILIGLYHVHYRLNQKRKAKMMMKLFNQPPFDQTK